MKKTGSWAAGCAAAICMLVLILDAPTALRGAQEGLELCQKTIIPSLFPFFVLSGLLTASMTGRSFALLRPVGRLCKIPQGYESLLLIGLLGGYPVGAQCVAQSWKDGRIGTSDARRLLGFCSNAGPAFLFGIVGQQFPAVWMAWLLWGIHILSALTTGLILSGKPGKSEVCTTFQNLSIPEALDQGLKTTARVCGWVILFRVILGFLDRWFLWRLPGDAQVLFSGILELSNGCWALGSIGRLGLRFVICSVVLAFGGLCVIMQTMSLTGQLGLGLYLPGKLIQTILSFQMSYFAQRILLPADQQLVLPTVLTTAIWLIILFLKISVAFPRWMVYNPVKS